MKCEKCQKEIFGSARPLCDECSHKEDHGPDDDYDYSAEADTSYWE